LITNPRNLDQAEPEEGREAVPVFFRV